MGGGCDPPHHPHQLRRDAGGPALGLSVPQVRAAPSGDGGTKGGGVVTETEKILEKVRNLLRLAGDKGNENEAAAAAAAAQKLIERHRLDMAMLDEGADDRPSAEEVRECEDPLDRGKAIIAWKGKLAGGLCAANGCRNFWRSGCLIIVGAPSDVQTVRYLYAYFVREINRLAKQYAGNGKSWTHAWRVGCASIIAERLRKAAEEARNDARGEAQSADERGVALVRVDAGIARIDARSAVATKYLEGLKLTKTKTVVRANGGFQQGQIDGRHVQMAGGSAALGAGVAGSLR